MWFKLNNTSSVSIWDYIIVLIIIYVSGKTLIFSANINPTYVLLFNIFPILFLPFLYLYVHGKKSYLKSGEIKRLEEFFVAFCALLVLSAIFNLDFRGGYVITLLFFLTSYIYVRTVPLNKFLSIFENIVWWITLVSVPVFIISYFVPNIRALFPTITNAGFNTYANLFITVIPLWDTDSSLFRLYGPFNEPGMYQIYLNLALLFHIHLNGRLQLKKAIVYILALLLTLSTAGYICLAFVLLGYMFSLNRRENKYKNYAIALLIIIAFGLIYTQTTLLTSESDVFRKFSAENVSAVSREASVIVNLETFMKNPIAGVGFSNIQDIFESICQSKYGFSQGISNTNSILFPFATLGLFFGLFWCYGIYLFARIFGANITSRTLTVLAVFLMMSGELVFGCFWIYAFIGYGILEKRKSWFRK